MTQPTLYGDPSNVPHAKGSRTSRMAAEQISREPAKREAKRDRLLRAYVEAGARGLTDSEAEAVTGLPRSSICSLRTLLKRMGWIRPEYDSRPGPYGHQQGVWTSTTSGREASR
jgi:hypothetical protein